MESVARLALPEDFDDYAWEVEAKGVFWDAFVETEHGRTAVQFYTPMRLMQDLEEELGSGGCIPLDGVIVVRSLTRRDMEAAVLSLAQAGRWGR